MAELAVLSLWGRDSHFVCAIKMRLEPVHLPDDVLNRAVVFEVRTEVANISQQIAQKVGEAARIS
jgi:hypothetical protein